MRRMFTPPPATFCWLYLRLFCVNMFPCRDPNRNVDLRFGFEGLRVLTVDLELFRLSLPGLPTAVEFVDKMILRSGVGSCDFFLFEGLVLYCSPTLVTKELSASCDYLLWRALCLIKTGCSIWVFCFIAWGSLLCVRAWPDTVSKAFMLESSWSIISSSSSSAAKGINFLTLVLFDGKSTALTRLYATSLLSMVWSWSELSISPTISSPSCES